MSPTTAQRDEYAKSGLGASEVPSLFDESPFGSQTDIWLDRMGLARPRASSGPMSVGVALEGHILALAGLRLETTFRRNRVTFRHPRWPVVPLFATPDGFGPGRSTLAEVKLVGYRFADWKDGPAPYAVRQVQSQLACLPGSTDGVLIALLGSDLRTYRIARDPAVEAAIEERVAGWWTEHIVGEKSPAPSSTDDEWNVLRATASTTGRAERLATNDEQVVAAQLLEIAKHIATEEARAERLKLILADHAGDSDVLGLGWAARWSSRSSTSWKDVAQAAGATDDLIAAHTKASASFAVRPQKEDSR